MYSKPKLLALVCLVLFTAGMVKAQYYNVNDPRWDINPRTSAVYPSGQYVTLPQIITVPTGEARFVHTPEGILIVYPSIQVLPSGSTSQTEVPLVACRTNPNFMFGSSNAVSGSTINSGSYITTNGGNNWFGSNIINNGNSNNQRGDPGPTIDKNQVVIFTHLSSSTVFGGVTGMAAEYSTNFGVNFSASVQVHSDVNDDKNLAGTDDNPGSPYYGNSYFAWTSFSTSPANGRFSRTTNGGVSWSTPIVINSTPSGHNAQGHDVDAAPNGHIFVCWTAGVTGSPFTEDFVGVAKSTNGGVSFTATENAFDDNGTRSTSFNGWGIRTNGFPRISIDKSGGPRNGWIYIVTDEYNLSPAGSDADVVLHRSTDDGTTWSAGIRVNQDPLNNGKVQFFPCINVDADGGVNVLYYDNRNFPSSGDSCSVFVSRSLDGGNTWTDVELATHHFRPKPTPGLSGGYMGDYLGVTSGNGKVWGFWTDDKSGTFNAWAGSMSAGSPPSHDVSCGPFLSLPSSFLINTAYDIKTKITNLGTSNESTIPVKWFINGSLINTTNKSLNSGQSDSVSNMWTPTTAGTYNLMYASALANDTNRFNDTVKVTVTVYSAVPPLCEGFSGALFPPQDWSLAYSGTLYWSQASPSAWCLGTNSAEFDFYDALQGTQQSLITKNFTATTGNTDSLVFMDAYATFTTENDQLQILTSTDNGTTFTSLVTLNGGVSGELVTAPPQLSPFTPTCTQWRRQVKGLPIGTNKIKFTAISAYGNNLYLDSICVAHPTGIQPITSGIPRTYTLSQNYPNPFNPTTVIKYGVPKQGFVKLVVYDILGREVRTLVNEVKPAGVFEVSFDASAFASGVYFYRITSGDFTDVKKMMLIK